MGIRVTDGRKPAVEVPVLHGEAPLQERYDRLVAQVMRLGGWLSSPQASLLPLPEWDRQFRSYQEQLEQLRQLGDQLRQLGDQLRPRPPRSAPSSPATTTTTPSGTSS